MKWRQSHIFPPALTFSSTVSVGEADKQTCEGPAGGNHKGNNNLLPAGTTNNGPLQQSPSLLGHCSSVPASSPHH